MNAQTEISRMRDEIMLRLKIAYRDLDTLREICTHPNLKKVHRSSPGNYDPSMDRYWTDVECLDCGAAWREEGST